MEALPATAPSAAPAAAPAPSERRRFARVSVSFFGTVRLAGGGASECLIIDLSLGGAKVVLSDPLPLAPADALALEIEKFGAFRATAVWRRGVFAGIRFLEAPETLASAFGSFLPSAN
jgi:PilZ domain